MARKKDIRREKKRKEKEKEKEIPITRLLSCHS